MTFSQVLRGLLHSTPAAVATFTLPTATLLVGGDASAEVGTGFQFSLRNDSGANAITVAIGTGGTLAGSATVAVSSASLWFVRYTNVSSGTEAYELARLA